MQRSETLQCGGLARNRDRENRGMNNQTKTKKISLKYRKYRFFSKSGGWGWIFPTSVDPILRADNCVALYREDALVNLLTTR